MEMQITVKDKNDAVKAEAAGREQAVLAWKGEYEEGDRIIFSLPERTVSISYVWMIPWMKPLSMGREMSWFMRFPLQRVRHPITPNHLQESATI